jgi:alpha-glucosidase (family GH31 glycosyl hydrolase)
MEIDDRWQPAYGELEFDPRKFPDAPAMVERLHDLGFAVTLWVMPFFEERSAAYRCVLGYACCTVLRWGCR